MAPFNPSAKAAIRAKDLVGWAPAHRFGTHPLNMLQPPALYYLPVSFEFPLYYQMICYLIKLFMGLISGTVDGVVDIGIEIRHETDWGKIADAVETYIKVFKKSQRLQRRQVTDLVV